MRILVTGATGFLGGVTARKLAQRGHPVPGLGRDEVNGAALEGNGVQFIRADLRKTPPNGCPLWPMPTRRCTLPPVPHCGAGEGFVTDNITVSRDLALACAARGLRLVDISTPSVYNAADFSCNVPESAPIGPRSDTPYARSKYLAELEATAAHPGATILRPRGIYGVGDTAIIPRLTCALSSGRLPRLVRGEVHTSAPS